MEDQQFDVTRKFVRVTGEREGGLIEFEFSVGDPELVVELIMPRAAFAAFCADNRVTLLEAASARSDSDFAWTLHDATHQRFR
ncbi:MAG: phenol hydroxylase subunit [Zoogloea sp.]|uniref:phenol hydroxylase subunit n=1 Tax=Zoogloea sp. TaxID=49181 RepID=UPI002613EBA1|nr:phenol hydroxylase subunit [Zoogloea sp.]MDD2988376.1 phenol hydroxylase subunit [Zoogloea sp.]